MPIRSYKIRFYPTRTQERALAHWFGQSRFAWNHGLAERRRAWEERAETRTSVDLGRDLTAMKRTEDFAWLADVPCAVHAQALRDLDGAYRAFFAGRSRHPRFKSKHRSATSARVDFDCRHRGKARAWNEDALVLPKIGACKVRTGRRNGRRLPVAMPKLVTVKRDPAGRYWVAFSVEEPNLSAPAPSRASVGVDAGARRLATLSTGERFQHPRALLRHLGALKTQQQRLARQCKGSNRRARTKQRLARIHAHIAGCRREALHRVSRRIVDENQVVCVETLDVKGMTASARGTVDTPGTGVTAKSQKNRALLDASMADLLRQLRYKSEWYGRTHVAVAKDFPSSQLCSACGFLQANLPLEAYRWTCDGCGANHDRDVNAAINIEVEGLRLISIHPEEPGGVRAPAGTGESPAGTGSTAVTARIGRTCEDCREQPEA